MLRLTERLNFLDSQHDMSDDQPLLIEQSICHYLANILNTRTGSVAITPHVGMPIMNLSTAGRHSDELIAYIKNQVLEGELRIKQFETISISNTISNALVAFTAKIQCYDLSTFKCQIKVRLDNTVEVSLL
ncbi:hypothetical protein PULV_b0821 [Pseudoalteromonas ulvae UL12]|uniref:IraD/Gp25-like domain-containing protein n=1 Tax=Pseudoalteromonas ulvae TaxID=107327 RepID=A0A244CRH4_PSEDV|nr:hypothetical protein [Pseudoalteromonas ulvae]MBE0366082.1 hypothetical protein [Pseudoalteromonas ulvae UL12]OUL58195.1 hypothetical protein B1199_07525 [Pseudoalteromonas ulvae]